MSWTLDSYPISSRAADLQATTDVQLYSIAWRNWREGWMFELQQGSEPTHVIHINLFDCHHWG